MELIENIPVWGTPDPGALSQIETCAQTADKVALRADHHEGYAVPIGGVVAYKDSISPSGVGYNIACGNKAVLLDIPGEVLRKDISAIMDLVWNTTSFGVGRRLGLEAVLRRKRRPPNTIQQQETGPPRLPSKGPLPFYFV
jgi:tRNA-splicing ligase RtcB